MPNRLFFGTTGVENVDQAMTQPSWVAFRHPGMCWKSPPTSLPFLTSTSPPSTIADSSFLRTAGLLSTSLAISVRRTNDPCEWPMSTKPRPWLSWAR